MEYETTQHIRTCQHHNDLHIVCHDHHPERINGGALLQLSAVEWSLSHNVELRRAVDATKLMCMSTECVAAQKGLCVCGMHMLVVQLCHGIVMANESSTIFKVKAIK
jgi:hypothetical protein